jgi:hypothetical protein
MQPDLARPRPVVVVVLASLIVGVLAVATPSSKALAAGLVRQVALSGTTTLRSLSTGSEALRSPELPKATEMERLPANRKNKGGFPQSPLPTPVVASSSVVAAGSEKLLSFQGLNHRQQRLANGGNQFSLEPPDQALCVGNGFVLESVNDVLRVFNTTAGTAVTGVMDLNSFYGYAAQYNRTTGAQGPFVTDPTCYYDRDTSRWFHLVLTLDVNPASGDFTGTNHLDLAVSTTADPTGAWNIYRIPAQNDGTQGTPNHHCTYGPCFGDFPHLGADANGIYITTNEYALFNPVTEYKTAQIYALPKAALAAGTTTLRFAHLDNLYLSGVPGFTLWPAISPASQYQTANGGTEYFLSSFAGDGSETGNPTRTDNRVGLWALTNTRSLAAHDPELEIQKRALRGQTYVFPPRSNQKAGDFPLGQCINDTTMSTPFGPGCWQYIFFQEPAHNEVEGMLDSSDTRFLTVTYANGMIWGALGTGVMVGGQKKAGVAYYVIQPGQNDLDQSRIVKQGYVAVAGNNLIYPSIAILPNGKGFMSFTLVGSDHYPTAAYAPMDVSGVGSIRVAAEGVGPQDGFSEYNAFQIPPRWGDYGMAVTDGNSIWVGNEYIAQTCTLAQYAGSASSPFGSCGGTRTALANWSTRITKLTSNNGDDNHGGNGHGN